MEDVSHTKLDASIPEMSVDMVAKKPACWKSANLINTLHPSAKIISWLLYENSLTKRIKSRCEEMEVVVLSERFERPLVDECEALNLGSNEEAWVRCVLLRCDKEDWIYARTVIPSLTADSPWKSIQKLGNRPLGEVLFGLPNVKRTAFEFSLQLLDNWPKLIQNLSQPINKQLGFVRRSCFSQQQSRLLLTEVFLKELP